MDTSNNTQSETLSQVALKKGYECGLQIFKEIITKQFGNKFANRAEQIGFDKFRIDGIEFLLTRDYNFNPAPYTLRVRLDEYSYVLANDWFELGLALSNLKETK